MTKAMKSPPNNYITLKQRVKDKHAKTLLKLSKEVNFVFNYINECCGARTGSKDVAGLGKRNWSCVECGTSHDRDINSANNVLMRGHAHLAKGIHFL